MATHHGFPPPVAFGLPAHFADWRPGQIEAILHATESPERMTGLVLPTGFGKSLVYMAAAHMSGSRAVILTSTKALQRQLTLDFNALGATLVQGQSSYVCTALQPGGELVSAFGASGRDTVMVDHGPCHLGAECSLKARGCGYFDAIRQAQQAQIVITNYAWWFTLQHQPQIRLVPDLLILDEAHAAPDALADALGATVGVRDVKEIVRQDLPGAKKRTPHAWREWAEQTSATLVKMLSGAHASSRDTARKIRRAQWLQKSLARVASLDARLLLVSDEPDAVRFDVVWAAPYAEGRLFRSIKRLLFTSATFTAHTAELLGIAPNDIAIYEAGTGFAKERRPVYIVPAVFAGIKVVRIDHRLAPLEEQAWLDHMDQIHAPRGDRKGIVHTVSYQRRDTIMARSKFRDRMVTHGRHDAAEKIARFKDAPAGTILVSPSVTTGYDFPYDQCEYQIIAKIPFPDSRDPVTAARSQIDAKYPAHVAMQELVQEVGRGMRADDDQCETFIVDGHANWFLTKHADLAPRWFRRALIRTTTLPTPPPPLGRSHSHSRAAL